MKVEIKTNEQGICEYLKINGKEYGIGIEALDIQIRPYERTKIIITTRSKGFILDSENTKLFLKEEGK